MHRGVESGSVCVPSRLGASYTDIARASPMLVHGASSFGSEQGATSGHSFRIVSWLQVISLDPGSIVRGPSISRGAATMSDVVENRAKRTRGEGFGGERGSRGRRPVFS